VEFRDFDLSDRLLQALDELGWTTPTPIQAGTIEHLLADRDVIGQAQTGSGKTAAFMLPILERIDIGSGDLQAIVLCPTRELALQVADMSRALAANLEGVSVVPVYGGAPIREQIDRLARGAQVVVGTPGRVLDLLQRGRMVLADCRMVVLDEADEMLSMGFIDDIRAILKHTPWGKQTALFSATMPPPIRKLAEEELHSPRLVRVTPDVLTVETIDQRVVDAEPREKLDKLEEILEVEDPGCAIVFARTKLGTARLADDLFRRGHKVRALHGDMTQSARDSVMLAFRAKRVKLLVATDVAARGLDVSHVTHVINYELPDEPEVYVHRIGRTGRVGRDGAAISIVSKRERKKLQAIEALIRRPIERWNPDAERGDEDEFAPTTGEPPTGGEPGDAGAADGAPPRRRRRGRRGGQRNRPRTPAQQ
jgi:ATP-dependent RNA helicase DeaD